MLVDYANADGTGAFPGVELIMEDTGLSRSTVQRALRELRNGTDAVPLIFIRRQRRFHTSNTYKFCIEPRVDVSQGHIDSEVDVSPMTHSSTLTDESMCHPDPVNVSPVSLYQSRDQPRDQDKGKDLNLRTKPKTLRPLARPEDGGSETEIEPVHDCAPTQPEPWNAFAVLGVKIRSIDEAVREEIPIL